MRLGSQIFAGAFLAFSRLLKMNGGNVNVGEIVNVGSGSTRVSKSQILPFCFWTGTAKARAKLNKIMAVTFNIFSSL